MIRVLHRWPGLLALVLVTILALSGAVLSVFPMAERQAAPQAVAGQSVADLAARVAATHPGLEEFRRSPSGTITAWWFDGGTPGSAVIDPATGADVGSADPNGVERWLTNLHRSLFLDDAGRLVMAAGAVAMLVLALSGAALVARRTGGWRRWFARLRGPLAGRLHVELARVAVLGLALSAATALWMTASTFDLLPDGAARPADPAVVSGQMAFPLDQMAALQDVPVDTLRKLSFPYAGDAQDVFTLSTDAGTGLIDQGTGEVLSWADLTPWQQVSETIYMLHTGQGAATLGLVLGLIALSVPVMGATGTLIWAAGSAPAARQCARGPGADGDPCRLRRRQHLGLCRDAGARPAGCGSGGAHRADVGLRPGPMPKGGALPDPRRHLRRRRRARVRARLPRPDGAENPDRAAGRAGFWRPQFPGLLRLCGRG